MDHELDQAEKSLLLVGGTTGAEVRSGSDLKTVEPLGTEHGEILWFTMVYCGLLWFTMVNYYGLLWFPMVYYDLLWFYRDDNGMKRGTV